METEYFACDWLVNSQSIQYIQVLSAAATACDADLVIVPQVYWRTNQPVVDVCVLALPGADSLSHYIEAAAQRGVLITWHHSNVTCYHHDLAFDPRRMRPFEAKTWQVRTRLAARHNRQISASANRS